MNMAPIDWVIVGGVLAILMGGVWVGRSHMKSVADFLAANRSAGRYLLCVSQGIAGFGAITAVGLLEMNYVAGFSMTWWSFTMGVVTLVVTVSGWVIYRFRQTRALTLAEFFERRYSRNFRVFAGLLAWLSGIINFGIFPAVVARFFIYFCGIPNEVALAGLMVPTFPVTMIVLLSIALFFVYSGGQVTVIITDFLQGLFLNVVFVVVTVFLMTKVSWTQIAEALGTAPAGASLINPYHTSQVKDFNFWYFLIGIFGVIYGTMSWQGTQAYNASARNAHEAKMGNILNNWRDYPRNLLILMVPVIAYTVMRHPGFATNAAAVQSVLDTVGNEAVQNQLRVPLVLTTLLPAGLMGAFAAVMLAAFISTHDTYLHSWGSIFIQDVVMPFRKTPFTQAAHLRALRLSILGVAVFIFFFSLIFRQSQYIFLFFAVTGAIFAGGSGAVIIGGLYWRRGTAGAAWAAMITGSTIAVGGIVVHQIADDFFINGQMFWAIAMFASSIVYVVVSLAARREPFDLDRLLHRGAYALADDTRVVNAVPSRGWRLLAMGREFSKGDRALTIATYIQTIAWTLVFVVGTVYNLRHDVPDATWARFWRVYVTALTAMSLGVIAWFTIGGAVDIRRMLSRLRMLQRDEKDDGRVARDTWSD